MKTKLIFVRHGEACGNIDRVFHGFTNSALTERGRQQIRRLGKRLSAETIHHIYSSDLKRAYETALAVAEPHGLEVIIDPRFREINGGRWEEVEWSSLPERFPESYRLWVEEPHAVTMPDGESMAEFFMRLRSRVEEILLKHAGQTVCIATHGTAIRVLNCYFRGKPLTELNDISWCDNASVTVAEYDGQRFTVTVDGDNAHLADISTLSEQDWWKKRS